MHRVCKLHPVHVTALRWGVLFRPLLIQCRRSGPSRSHRREILILLQGEIVPKKTSRPVLLVAAGIGEHMQAAGFVSPV